MNDKPSFPFALQIEKIYSDFNIQAELNLAKGEFFSLLGPSGSGKTTLLRLIAGLEKVDSGKIILNNIDVTHLPPAKRKIGMVFQDYALFPHLKVYENIQFGLKAQKISLHESKQKIMRMLSLFQIEHIANREVEHLSGGERQRVALARALAIEPHILLLDEPFSALDYSLRNKLRQELQYYQKKLGFTCIFVTHQQEEALSISDRVGVMQAGRIVQIGNAHQIYEEPASPFVASFIGEANLFPCEINQEESGLTLTLFTKKNPLIRENCSPGKYLLFIRPEDIKLNDFSINDICFEEVIQRVEYLGFMFRIEFNVNNHIIKVYTDKKYPLKEGERIKFAISQEKIRFINP